MEDPNAGTPEQRTLIRKIRRTECYYEVLGVEKTASEDQIKRAYRCAPPFAVVVGLNALVEAPTAVRQSATV